MGDGVGSCGSRSGIAGVWMSEGGLDCESDGIDQYHGFWGEIPSSNSSIRVSGAKLGKVARSLGITIPTMVERATRLLMTHSAT